MSQAEAAAVVVQRCLHARPADVRGQFLRELLAHTAAGLVVTEGNKASAEAVYRLADAIVARDK